MGAFLLAVALLPGVCYPPPLDAPIVDPFRAPACAQCAGNRGLEYATDPGTAVAAVAPGTVSFSGVVAGTRYVVVDQPDGYRATYGRLAAATVALGSQVRAGAVVGTTTGAFYFGLRLGDDYVDPAPLLGRYRDRPRLVPVSGANRRAPPPPRLACAAG
ncbi:MAG: M23 family metallopeptidase [Ilumatobacteraceae bacterium]